MRSPLRSPAAPGRTSNARVAARRAVTKATAQFADAPLDKESEKKVFPVNYSPKTAVRFINLTAYEVSTEDVTTIVVDESAARGRRHRRGQRGAANRQTPPGSFSATSRAPTTSGRRPCARSSTSPPFNDDVVFADEVGPNYLAPLFKFPSVPPHTLLSYNLVGRPALLRTRTLRNLGGFDLDAGWAFEHDAYLRLSETRRRLSPRQPGPSRGTSAARVRARTHRRRHVSGDREGVGASRLDRRRSRRARFRASRTGNSTRPSPQPSIDVIIPTRDRIDLVRNCIEALENSTTYQNWNIILLDNDSVEPESLEYFAELEVPGRALSRTVQLRQDRQSRGRSTRAPTTS